jgi:hypothetical protein
MHAAHRSVGVSGIASIRQRPSVERPWCGEPATASMRVSLVSRAYHNQSLAAMAAFERVLAGSSNLECHRLDLATAEADGLGDADCGIVFGRGLQILSRWSAFHAKLFACGGVEEDDGIETEIEVAAAARWHPVVDGVGRFIARSKPFYFAHFRAEERDVLVGKWRGEAFPVGWVRQGSSRAFYTSLGHPKDFRRREFVRLLLNAIEWVSC